MKIAAQKLIIGSLSTYNLPEILTQ